jgi:hypothetical protein
MLFFILLGPAFVSGQQPWPRERLNSADLPWVRATAANTPKAIRVQLDGTFGFDEFESAPPHICRFDLNNDKQPEYILESPYRRGGPMTAIFQLRNGNWVHIARFQGGIHISSERINGYPSLESWNGRFGVTLRRTLRQFRTDRYHVVRVEEWDDSEPNHEPTFLRALDPRDDE